MKQPKQFSQKLTLAYFPGNCGIKVITGWPYVVKDILYRDNTLKYLSESFADLDVYLAIPSKNYSILLVTLNHHQMSAPELMDGLTRRGFVPMNHGIVNPNSANKIQVFFRYFSKGRAIELPTPDKKPRKPKE